METAKAPESAVADRLERAEAPDLDSNSTFTVSGLISRYGSGNFPTEIKDEGRRCPAV
jgi:hypothetical protein